MIRAMAEKAAGLFVREQVIGEQDRGIYAYGMEMLISETACTAAVLGIGLSAGRLAQAVTYICMYTVIRVYAGGYHAESHRNCIMIFSMCFSLLMTVVERLDSYGLSGILVPCTVLSVGIIFLLAPVENYRKPLTKNEYRIFRKKARKNSLYYSLAAIIVYTCCPALQNEMEYGMAAVCEIAVLLLAGSVKAGFKGIGRHERKDSVKRAWLRLQFAMIQEKR